MVSFGHTAVGVIVGTTTYNILGEGNLAAGLLITGAAGFISHYLMDFIPHGHFTMPQGYKKDIFRIIIFDLLLSIILFLGLTYLKSGIGEKLLFVMFGIGGSQLPDVIGGLIFTHIVKARGLLKIENNFHENMHWRGKADLVRLLGLSDIWQIAVILIAFTWVFFF